MASVGKSNLSHVDDSVSAVIDKMLKRFFKSEKVLTDKSDDENIRNQAKCVGYLALVKGTITKAAQFEMRLTDVERKLGPYQFNMGLFEVPNNEDLR